MSAGYVDKRDKRTRRQRGMSWTMISRPRLDQLGRSVVAADQIRTVIRTFKESLPILSRTGNRYRSPDLYQRRFPCRGYHAHLPGESLERGNKFCKKIAYRTTGKKPGPDPEPPELFQAAYCGNRGHGQHSHGHQAAGMPAHAGREIEGLFRTDDRPLKRVISETIYSP